MLILVLSPFLSAHCIARKLRYTSCLKSRLRARKCNPWNPAARYKPTPILAALPCADARPVSRHTVSVALVSPRANIRHRHALKFVVVVEGHLNSSTSWLSRLAAISQYFSSISMPMALRPKSLAARSVVPLPMKGSTTTSDSSNPIVLRNPFHKGEGFLGWMYPPLPLLTIFQEPVP